MNLTSMPGTPPPPPPRVITLELSENEAKLIANVMKAVSVPAAQVAYPGADTAHMFGLFEGAGLIDHDIKPRSRKGAGIFLIEFDQD